ncbi:hypothetical protein QJT91_22915, partial [Bordetella bronchiseptica]
MKKSIFPCAASLLCLFGLGAAAQTVTPLQGQSPETTQQDMAACQAQAGSTSTSSAGTDGSRSGGRVRGAAAGAARRLFVLTTRTSHWFMKRGF